MSGYSLTIPTQNGSGFTVLPTSTNNYYCSSSGGNDANNGLTSGAPKATLAAVMGLATQFTGVSVTVHLKAGDVWSEAFPAWKWQGVNRADPFVVTSYGTGARPIINSGGLNAIDCGAGGGNPASLSHVWFVGLELYDDVRDPDSGTYDAGVTDGVGIQWRLAGADTMVEDCKISFFTIGIDAEATGLSDIRLRRNTIYKNYATVGHAQGIFESGTTDLLIEGNTIDNNGWLTGVTGADKTVFNHGIYLYGPGKFTIRDNVISNSSSFGLKLASDTFDGLVDVVVTDNVFAGNVNGIAFGGSADPTVDYVYRLAVVTGNVFDHQGGIIGTDYQNFGITISSIDTATVTGNYFINTTAGTGSPQGTRSEFILKAFANKDVAFTGNTIYGWGGEDIDNSASPASGITTTPNSISATSWARNIPTYDTSIGGDGTVAHFITQARAQTAAAWDTSYTAPLAILYIQFTGTGVIDTYNKRESLASYGTLTLFPRAGTTKDVAWRRQMVGLYPFEGPQGGGGSGGVISFVRHSLFGAAQRLRFFRKYVRK